MRFFSSFSSHGPQRRSSPCGFWFFSFFRSFFALFIFCLSVSLFLFSSYIRRNREEHHRLLRTKYVGRFKATLSPVLDFKSKKETQRHILSFSNKNSTKNFQCNFKRSSLLEYFQSQKETDRKLLSLFCEIESSNDTNYWLGSLRRIERSSFC